MSDVSFYEAGQLVKHIRIRQVTDLKMKVRIQHSENPQEILNSLDRLHVASKDTEKNTLDTVGWDALRDRLLSRGKIQAK